VRVEVAAQGGHEILRVDPDDKADLAGRARLGRDRVDRVFRVAGGEGQHLEAHQPNTFSLGVKAGFAPVGSISGAFSPPSTMQSASAARTEFGMCCGTHSRTLIAPLGLVIVASAAPGLPGIGQ